MTQETRILSLALKGLYAERERIEREISDLQKRLRGKRIEPDVHVLHLAGSEMLGKKRRRSAATKKAISRQMKVYWAKKRAANE